MGNSRIYYKKCLQYFAYALASMENRKSAEKFLNETSDEKLEQFILEKKSLMDIRQYYFEAGRATQYMIEEVDRDDTIDGFNAAAAGVSEFMQFLELKGETI